MNCILPKAPIGGYQNRKKERLDQGQPENLISTNATDKKRKNERQDKTRREKKRKEGKFSAAPQICRGRLVLNRWEDNVNVSK